ncbi:MAG: T9SS type A sorting domain-containing protein, partial [Bacteroidales bacterium]|nr:T9SS type A sorting domain-containing protein [Bacteroidales bacterium]
NVFAVAGGIMVETVEAANVEVYTIAGVLVNAQTVSGSATIEMPQGVYIVKVADKVEKVIVK